MTANSNLTQNDLQSLLKESRGLIKSATSSITLIQPNALVPDDFYKSVYKPQFIKLTLLIDAINSVSEINKFNSEEEILDAHKQFESIINDLNKFKIELSLISLEKQYYGYLLREISDSINAYQQYTDSKYVLDKKLKSDIKNLKKDFDNLKVKLQGVVTNNSSKEAYESAIKSLNLFKTNHQKVDEKIKRTINQFLNSKKYKDYQDNQNLIIEYEKLRSEKTDGIKKLLSDSEKFAAEGPFKDLHTSVGDKLKEIKQKDYFPTIDTPQEKGFVDYNNDCQTLDNLVRNLKNEFDAINIRAEKRSQKLLKITADIENLKNTFSFKIEDIKSKLKTHNLDDANLLAIETRFNEQIFLRPSGNQGGVKHFEDIHRQLIKISNDLEKQIIVEEGLITTKMANADKRKLDLIAGEVREELTRLSEAIKNKNYTLKENETTLLKILENLAQKIEESTKSYKKIGSTSHATTTLKSIESNQTEFNELVEQFNTVLEIKERQKYFDNLLKEEKYLLREEELNSFNNLINWEIVSESLEIADKKTFQASEDQLNSIFADHQLIRELSINEDYSAIIKRINSEAEKEASNTLGILKQYEPSFLTQINNDKNIIALNENGIVNLKKLIKESKDLDVPDTIQERLDCLSILRKQSITEENIAGYLNKDLTREAILLLNEHELNELITVENLNDDQFSRVLRALKEKLTKDQIKNLASDKNKCELLEYIVHPNRKPTFGLSLEGIIPILLETKSEITNSINILMKSETTYSRGPWIFIASQDNISKPLNALLTHSEISPAIPFLNTILNRDLCSGWNAASDEKLKQGVEEDRFTLNKSKSLSVNDYLSRLNKAMASPDFAKISKIMSAVNNADIKNDSFKWKAAFILLGEGPLQQKQNRLCDLARAEFPLNIWDDFVDTIIFIINTACAKVSDNYKFGFFNRVDPKETKEITKHFEKSVPQKVTGEEAMQANQDNLEAEDTDSLVKPK